MVEEPKPETKKWPSAKQRIKIVALAVLALLVLIVILENTDAVDIHVLFFPVTVPKAVMLFGSLTVGFILGIIAASRIFTKK